MHCKSQTTANVKNKSIEILSIRNKIRSRLEYFLYLFFVLILHFGQVRALRQNPQKKSFSSSHDLRCDAMND